MQPDGAATVAKENLMFSTPARLVIRQIHDREAGVFTLTSPDLRGLVVEVPDNASKEAIRAEILNACSLLLDTKAPLPAIRFEHGGQRRKPPQTSTSTSS